MSQDFLSQVAADMYPLLGGQITMVFPMSRGGLFMRERLRELFAQDCDQQRTIIMPRMVTINELIDSLCPLEPDEELRSVVALYRIYRHIAQSQPNDVPNLELDVFYGWGRQLYADFSDVDMALLNPQQLFSNSVEAHHLEMGGMSEQTRDRLLALLGREWREQDECARKQFENLWRAIPSMYEAFNASQEEIGVGSMGARLRYLITHWDEARIQSMIGKRMYVFVGFNYLLGGERELMLRLKRRNETRFYWDYDPDFCLNDEAYKFLRRDRQEMGSAVEITGRVENQQIHVVSASTTSSQAQYVHDWLITHHREGEKTAVIMADEGMLESVVYALPTHLSDKVNITKGYPLRSTNIYRQVIDEISYPLVMPSCLTRDEQDVANDESASLSWQQTLRREATYQARCVIQQLIDLFAEGVLDDIHTLKTLRNIVRRALDAVSIPFHGEPVTDIQLMGVLESRLLDFDHLLILNVEEGVLPRQTAYHSFIPYYLRKYYGMQTSDEEGAIYAYNFFRLIRRCPDVTLTYSSAGSDKTRKMMSRFLMQMMYSDSYDIHLSRLVESNQIQADFELVPIVPAPVTYLSPSAISQYLACPRRFYYEKIAHLRTDDPDTLLLAPNEVGSLIHNAIRLFYESKDNNIQTLVNKSFTELYPDKDISQHPVECEVAVKHVKQVLEYDSKHPFIAIEGMECKRTIPLDVNGTRYTIGGTIDRLDRVVENGRELLRVLDYKTGSYDSKKLRADNWEQLFEQENGKSYMLQTLLYCLAAGADIPELLFSSKALNPDFDPHLYVDGQMIVRFSQVRDVFVEHLTKLLERIQNDTTFPKCEKCQPSCPFMLLCNRVVKKY